WMSIKAMSGRKLSASSTTALPVLAVAISHSSPKLDSMIFLRASSMIPSSSASMILYICLVPLSGLRNGKDHFRTLILPFTVYFHQIFAVIVKFQAADHVIHTDTGGIRLFLPVSGMAA